MPLFDAFRAFSHTHTMTKQWIGPDVNTSSAMTMTARVDNIDWHWRTAGKSPIGFDAAFDLDLDWFSGSSGVKSRSQSKTPIKKKSPLRSSKSPARAGQVKSTTPIKKSPVRKSKTPVKKTPVQSKSPAGRWRNYSPHQQTGSKVTHGWSFENGQWRWVERATSRSRGASVRNHSQNKKTRDSRGRVQWPAQKKHSTSPQKKASRPRNHWNWLHKKNRSASPSGKAQQPSRSRSRRQTPEQRRRSISRRKTPPQARSQRARRSKSTMRLKSNWITNLRNKLRRLRSKSPSQRSPSRGPKGRLASQSPKNKKRSQSRRRSPAKRSSLSTRRKSAAFAPRRSSSRRRRSSLSSQRRRRARSVITLPPVYIPGQYVATKVALPAYYLTLPKDVPLSMFAPLASNEKVANALLETVFGRNYQQDFVCKLVTKVCAQKKN